MKVLIHYTLSIFAVASLMGEPYPLRDPNGEGRPIWWWAMWRDPVVVIRGSVDQTEKLRPDLSVSAPWDTWRKLTAPSLANEPTIQGAHFLVSALTVSEVIYVDPALAGAHADFSRLAKGELTEINCILPAEIHDQFPGSDTVVGFKKYSDKAVDDEGLEAKFVYRCAELHDREDDEYLMVFQYSRLYPVQALVLYAVTSLEQLEEAKRLAQYRRDANKAE